MDKKEFALSQLAPYYKDRSLCALEEGVCTYLTEDGRMCVLGKNLINPGDIAFEDKGAVTILNKFGEDILKPESRGILTIDEWNSMQHIHDALATGVSRISLMEPIDSLNLFTLKELEDYATNR